MEASPEIETEKLRDVRRAIAAGQVAEGTNDAHVSYWLDRYAMVVADGTDEEAASRPRRKRSRQSA